MFFLQKKNPIVTEYVHNDAVNKSDLLGKDTNLPPGGDPFNPWPYAPPAYQNPHQPIYPPSLPPGYIGGEAQFFFGGGFSRVVCCDENGTKRIFWYSKVYIGGAIGFGGGGGAVVSGMSGKNCRGSNYTGWFYEAGVSRGYGGGGIDVGYEPFPGTENWPVPLPGGLSGVNEGGLGIGSGVPIFGLLAKSTWCYYTLISEKDIPCGCGK